MARSGMLSLCSVIAMAIAFLGSGIFLESNIVAWLQVAGYLLLAASYWLAGARAVALVLAICAITHAFKTLDMLRARVIYAFLAVALLGGAILNNSGWLGALPILAALGVICGHYNRQIEMDNASRCRGHAVDVFLYNIVGVTLWGVFAWSIGDRYMAAWRAFMLLVNLVDYIKRIWPKISHALARAVPDPGGHRRNRYPGQRKRGGWII